MACTIVLRNSCMKSNPKTHTRFYMRPCRYRDRTLTLDTCMTWVGWTILVLSRDRLGTRLGLDTCHYRSHDYNVHWAYIGSIRDVLVGSIERERSVKSISAGKSTISALLLASLCCCCATLSTCLLKPTVATAETKRNAAGCNTLTSLAS